MGLATATRFAAEGARVVAGDWNAARLDQAVTAIRDAGGTILGSPGNIADPATAEGLVDLAVSTYGRIHVLVNNAGVRDASERGYLLGIMTAVTTAATALNPAPTMKASGIDWLTRTPVRADPNGAPM
jgi:NAD(P)-dependent dehydrogenase (short-subunit alcohol dehydrogenase family)